MAIGRVNTGGGGSGGTLTVTGIAGHTVTATKDGKTYTRTFNSSGVAVFKGLSTGTWALTMTGDGQTATRTVDVNADYAITITYFSATISITYPAGSTCKATHTDGTVLNAPDTSGTWACVVPKSGTWTILAEDTSAGKSKSVDVSITTDGQSESVTLAYELVLFSGGAVVPWSKYDQDSGNVTIGSTISFGTTHVYKGAYTTNKIDVTNYNTLYCVGTVTDIPYNDDRKPRICIANSPIKDTPSNYGVAHTLLTKGTKTFTLDISSFTGEYYVEVWGVAALSITDVYLQ